MRDMNKLLMLLVPALLSTVPNASAQLIEEEDPEILFIGTGAGTACATGGCPVYGTEVNGLTFGTSTLSISSNPNTKWGINDVAGPLLLILGFVNPPGSFSAPGISSVTSYNPYPGTGSSESGWLGGTNVYQGTWDSSTGYVGALTASTLNQGKVYNFVGLNKPGSASEKWSNWAAAEAAVNGITAASFGIYVYTLDAMLNAGGLVDVTFDSPLPLGTFAIAYGCRNSSSTDSCVPAGDVLATPFTQSGLVVSTPEPDSLFLLATVLIAAVWSRHRSRNS